MLSSLLSFEMHTANRNQTLEEADCISQTTDILKKSMKPIILHPATKR